MTNASTNGGYVFLNGEVPTPANHERSVLVTFCVPESRMKALQEYADEHDCTTTSVINDAIESHIVERECDAETKAALEYVQCLALKCGINPEGHTAKDLVNEIAKTLDTRLMPPDTAWPKYSDSTPLLCGGAYIDRWGNEAKVASINVLPFGIEIVTTASKAEWRKFGETIDKPQEGTR